MIIALTGHKRAGKDTVGIHLASEYDFQPVRFAGKIKEICRILFGWGPARLETDMKEEVDPKWGISPREAMQYLGDVMKSEYIGAAYPEFDRINGNAFWARSLEQQIESMTGDIVVTDMRFPDEYDMLQKHGAIFIRIIRPCHYSGDDHWSESFIDGFRVDYNLINDGTIGDLYDNVDIIMQNIAKQC